MFVSHPSTAKQPLQLVSKTLQQQRQERLQWIVTDALATAHFLQNPVSKKTFIVFLDELKNRLENLKKLPPANSLFSSSMGNGRWEDLVKFIHAQRTQLAGLEFDDAGDVKVVALILCDIALCLESNETLTLEELKRDARRAEFNRCLTALTKWQPTQTPTCFISYAWGIPQHESWVHALAQRLQQAGVVVHLDIWCNQFGSVAEFTEKLHEADYVLVIGTPLLQEKWRDEEGRGHIVKQELEQIFRVKRKSPLRLVKVLLAGNNEDSFPLYLESFACAATDFSDSRHYEAAFFKLLLKLYEGDTAYLPRLTEQYTYFIDACSQIDQAIHSAALQGFLDNNAINQAVDTSSKEIVSQPLIMHQSLVNTVTPIASRVINKQRGFSIGESDFRLYRQQNTQLVDKSGFIKEIMDDDSKVKLIIRPRRFGKTLNMSMLYYYFAKQENSRSLFESLAIWQQGEPYRQAQGKYPVIFISFKDIKADTYEEAVDEFKELLSQLYLAHDNLLQSPILKPADKKFVQKMIDKDNLFPVDVKTALKKLTTYLHKHHQVPVVILIDEYDTPIQASYTQGYYEEMAKFIRSFLGEALKDNAALSQAVLTGILRIAKESIFSGLNNLRVYSALSETYGSCFGFTKGEVQELLGTSAESDMLQQVEAWYGGYQMGNQPIYSPWSIVNFLQDNRQRLARPEFDTYWVNTAENKLIEDMLTRFKANLEADYKQLMAHQLLAKPIDKDTVFKELETQSQALWSFLLLSGYLTVKPKRGHENQYELVIPNQELYQFHLKLIKNWFGEMEVQAFKPPRDILTAFDKDVAKHRAYLQDTDRRIQLIGMDFFITHVLMDADLYQKLILFLLDPATRKEAIALLAHLPDRHLRDFYYGVANLRSQNVASVLQAIEQLTKQIQDSDQMLIKLMSIAFIQSLKTNHAWLNTLIISSQYQPLISAIVCAVVQLIHKDESIIDTIMLYFSYEDIHVRPVLTEVLERLPEKSSKINSVLIPRLVEKDSKHRLAAIYYLREMGGAVDKVFETFVDCLHDEDNNVSQAAAFALEKVLSHSNTNYNIIPMLLNSLKSQPFDPESLAVTTLVKLGKTNEKFISCLQSAIKYEDDGLRLTVAYVLSQLKRVTAEQVTILLDNLSITNSEFRISTIKSIQVTKRRDAKAVSGLSGCLSDKNLQVRKAAFDAIAQLCSVNNELIGQLFSCLQDDIDFVRQSVIPSLVEFGKSNDKVIIELLKYLQLAPINVRLAIINSLGQLKLADTKVTDKLLYCLEDNEQPIRKVAAVALGRLGKDDVRVIDELCNCLQDKESWVKKAAVEVLGQLGKTNDKVIDSLIDCLKDKEYSVRGAVVEVLVRLGKIDDKVVDALINCLKDEEHLVREAAVQVLGRLGKIDDKVVDALINCLQDEERRVREAAVNALGQLGKADNKVIDALIGCLKDEERGVRKAAVNALGQLGKADNKVIDALIDCLQDKENWVRGAAVEFLGRLGGMDNKVIDALIDCLKDEERGVRKAAVQVLDRLGKIDDKVVDALIDCLKDKESWVRGVAVEVLGRLGGMDNKVIDALIDCLKDEEHRVRGVAVEVLGRLGGMDNKVIDALIDCLKDEEHRVGEAAVEVLGRLGKIDDKVVDALIDCLKDEEHLVREAAVKVLGRLGKIDDKVVDALINCLQDEERRVREAAVNALGQLGKADNKVIDALIDCLQGKDGRVKYLAAEALGCLAKADAKAIDALIDCLQDKDGRVEYLAAEALGWLAKADAKVIDALCHRLQDKEERVRIREAVASVLGQLGQADAKVIDALCDCLQAKENGVRQAAAEALTRLGLEKQKIRSHINSSSQSKYNPVNISSNSTHRFFETASLPEAVTEVQQTSVEEPIQNRSWSNNR